MGANTTESETRETGRAFEVAAKKAFTSIMITEGGSDASEHKIVFVNDAFTDMTGYTAEEVVGRSPGLMQGPKSNQELLEALQEKIKSGEDFHGTTTNYKKNGTEFTIEWKVLPVRDDAGTVTHHVAVQRDVSI